MNKTLNGQGTYIHIQSRVSECVDDDKKKEKESKRIRKVKREKKEEGFRGWHVAYWWQERVWNIYTCEKALT